MKHLVDRENQLKTRLEGLVIGRYRPRWRKSDSSMIPFPVLSEGNMRSLCFGSEIFFWLTLNFILFLGQDQIKQAKRHIKEHMTQSTMYQDELELVIEYCENHPDLVGARLVSRHCSSKNYLAIVQFDNNLDEEPITGWYFTCAAGAREVDCCAHVTALMWHLGVCRGEFETSMNPLTTDRFCDFVHDASAIEESSTIDDDQDENSTNNEHNID